MVTGMGAELMLKCLVTAGLFLSEDAAHYLIFSMLFLYAAPITLVLAPVFLFALLHFASYSLTLLDTLGQNSWWGARIVLQKGPSEGSYSRRRPLLGPSPG